MKLFGLATRIVRDFRDIIFIFALGSVLFWLLSHVTHY